MIKIANAPCSWGVLEFDLEGKAAGAVFPVAVPLSLDRKNEVHDARTQITGRINGIRETENFPAHPKDITIHPLLFPFVFARSTFETAPLPKTSIIAVPKNSEKNWFIGDW